MWSDDSDDDGSADDTRAAAASAPADDGLSAYERQRQENIDKNKKVLASLGLLGESTPGGLIERRVSNGPAVPREKKDYGARSLPGRSTRAPPERLSRTKLGGRAGRRGSSDAERAQQGASSSSDALMMLPPPPSAPFIPNCSECSGPAKRMKYETRRFVCLDPTCAHEVIWARRREIISCHAHTRAHTLYAQMQAPPCSLSHSLSLSLSCYMHMHMHAMSTHVMHAHKLLPRAAHCATSCPPLDCAPHSGTSCCAGSAASPKRAIRAQAFPSHRHHHLFPPRSPSRSHSLVSPRLASCTTRCFTSSPRAGRSRRPRRSSSSLRGGLLGALLRASCQLPTSLVPSGLMISLACPCCACRTTLPLLASIPPRPAHAYVDMCPCACPSRE